VTKRIDERAAFLSTRRQVLMAGAATGAALLLPTVPRVARAAGVPVTFDCDRASAFVMDPNEHKRVGYVTEFSGIGLPGPLGKAASATPSTSTSGCPRRTRVS
jgi:hypothetical protein